MGCRMLTRGEPRRPSAYLLMASLLFQGFSGLVGGAALTLDRTGSIMQLPLDWLQGSLFSDYRLPGVILFTVLGIFPLVALWGSWSRRPWSGAVSLIVGLALVIFIGVEISIIGYHPRPPLQVIYGLLGLAIVGLALRPQAPGSR